MRRAPVARASTSSARPWSGETAAPPVSGGASAPTRTPLSQASTPSGPDADTGARRPADAQRRVAVGPEPAPQVRARRAQRQLDAVVAVDLGDRAGRVFDAFGAGVAPPAPAEVEDLRVGGAAGVGVG